MPGITLMFLTRRASYAAYNPNLAPSNDGNTARTAAPAEESGAGLGLAIARGLVEAHAGRIEARNHGPACRFEILLPLATNLD